jgi:hypothetical protein
MTVEQKFVRYLISRGLTPDRADKAARLVTPLIEGYLAAIKICPETPVPSPFPDIDWELAETDSPETSEIIAVWSDSTVAVSLAALGVECPCRLILGGLNAPSIVAHFRSLVAGPLVAGSGGLKLYLGRPFGGTYNERWLAEFLTEDFEDPICERCYSRWFDTLAEDYLRFLAVQDDAIAATMEPWLEHISPHAQCIGLTKDGDLLFLPRP